MYEGIIQDLIDELGRLPGIGPKSAQRIAFHIVQSERVDVNRLVEVLRLVKEKVKFCSQCFNVAEEEECKISTKCTFDRNIKRPCSGELIVTLKQW